MLRCLSRVSVSGVVAAQCQHAVTHRELQLQACGMFVYMLMAASRWVRSGAYTITYTTAHACLHLVLHAVLCWPTCCLLTVRTLP